MTNSAALPGSDAFRLQTRLLLLLLGTTLAVFAGVCGHEFVHFDDNVNIYNNPHVRGLSGENLQWMFSNTTYARRYMPLGWLNYAVDYQLWGLNPQAYHAGNLVFHLANVALLFFLLKRLLLLMRGPSPSNESGTAPIWCAAIGALFWAVNPLRVENVAWASSRIYCAAFFFAALWLLAWLRAHDPETPETRRRLFYWLAVAAYAASLLTYPLAMFAPVVLFVLEVYPLRRMGARLADWWGPGAWLVWRDKIPFLAVAAGVLALTFFSLVHTDARFKPLTMEEFPPLSRAMQACYIWAYYVWKPWAPYDLAISYMTLHAFNPFAPKFVISAVLLASLTLALFWFRRRWPAALGLWLCHLILLVPVLGLTEYPHSAYDRYSYLPGMLWSAAIAVGLRLLWKRGQQGPLAGMAVAGVSLLFALLAWQQVPVWRDTIPLYQNMLAQAGEHPDRGRFDTVLGMHYLRAGATNEAIASFQNAIYYESRRPDRRFFDEGVLPVAHVCLGNVLSGQSRQEEALEHYQAAAQADPASLGALIGMGVTLSALHREAEALLWLVKAARLQPDSIPAHHQLGVLLEKMGYEQDARRHFDEERRLTEGQGFLARK